MRGESPRLHIRRGGEKIDERTVCAGGVREPLTGREGGKPAEGTPGKSAGLSVAPGTSTRRLTAAGKPTALAYHHHALSSPEPLCLHLQRQASLARVAVAETSLRRQRSPAASDAAPQPSHVGSLPLPPTTPHAPGAHTRNRRRALAAQRPAPPSSCAFVHTV
ncbi:hypothetical protein C8Q77DRAFT_1210581 [Trametes polyzona]|nr:hypothetical protein C8Q77DRAFT_1210581 [Trametes polyzona]